MILKCDCQHEYQEKKYGKDNRVHTPMKNGNYRCTVCLNVKVGNNDKKLK